MDLLKRWKTAMFVDNGLFLGLVLLVTVAFVWSRFLDWRGPIDDMGPQERARLEDCAMAERSLGDAAYRERPDCRDLFPSSLAARIAP